MFSLLLCDRKVIEKTMEILFLCIVIFLFLLAVFDLSVGVSNDAVNFLNSAIGSKAASFKRVLIVASIGVFIGAAMSNGMMDIARHGIFRPEHFSFYDLIFRPTIPPKIAKTYAPDRS